MKTEEINSLFKNLTKVIKNPKTDLSYKNKFTLLVSVVLSAQCTDVNVNNVTKNIYPKYYKPEHFVKLGKKKIEKLIKKIGIFRIKAKSIYLMSKQVLEKHKGKVPKTFDEFWSSYLKIYNPPPPSLTYHKLIYVQSIMYIIIIAFLLIFIFYIYKYEIRNIFSSIFRDIFV